MSQPLAFTECGRQLADGNSYTYVRYYSDDRSKKTLSKLGDLYSQTKKHRRRHRILTAPSRMRIGDNISSQFGCDLLIKTHIAFGGIPPDRQSGSIPHNLYSITFLGHNEDDLVEHRERLHSLYWSSRGPRHQIAKEIDPN
jgi:hypothetical protein